jgi:hypothetical protein
MIAPPRASARFDDWFALILAWRDRSEVNLTLLPPFEGVTIKERLGGRCLRPAASVVQPVRANGPQVRGLESSLLVRDNYLLPFAV